MSERRYSDQEVAEILDRATETGGASSSGGASSTGGLTLRELQEIGEEVGIPRDVVARAAASLDRPLPDPSAHRTFLGLRIGVGRAVDLPRPLTEDEWNRLVVDLRMTFDAKGKIRQDGAFRQWTNGNLQALLEPHGDGQRFRLRTLKGSAMPYMITGSVLLGVSAVGAIAGFLAGRAGGDFLATGLMGLAFFVAGRFRLPEWARTREHQMEEVILRLASSLEDDPTPS